MDDSLLAASADSHRSTTRTMAFFKALRVFRFTAQAQIRLPNAAKASSFSARSVISFRAKNRVSISLYHWHWSMSSALDFLLDAITAIGATPVTDCLWYSMAMTMNFVITVWKSSNAAFVLASSVPPVPSWSNPLAKVLQNTLRYACTATGMFRLPLSMPPWISRKTSFVHQTRTGGGTLRSGVAYFSNEADNRSGSKSRSPKLILTNTSEASSDSFCIGLGSRPR
mmetsp:Transcript_3899/g.9186  ORF Transcript_3899/g.9186 Transcript_3899/m.9186 type:complete len:226 (-) Transcript_3899:348-1025(-)